MEKRDYKKIWNRLYQASAKEISQIDVPPLNYLMIDGRGDPNTTPAFERAIEALYTVAYTIKFMIKKGPAAIDYGVLPLEGLWWAEEMSKFTANDKAAWQWTLMIMQPEIVTADLVKAALAEARHKKPGLPLAEVRFELLSEGHSVQILHVGPFSEEGPTIARLHQFIEAAGFARSGKHHEIYLSDMRRAAPAKWKTIIRQPIR